MCIGREELRYGDWCVSESEVIGILVYKGEGFCSWDVLKYLERGGGGAAAGAGGS